MAPEPERGLFAGTAWHYARFRPDYPSGLVDDVVAEFDLDGTGRLLDLGCGTGQLTVPLARHVAEAIGMDPEDDMLAEAAERARAANVFNVSWVQGASTDLPGPYGRFRLVTMGRSFHWMDREAVVTALDRMVDVAGGIVIANDGCLIRPTTAWQRAIDDVQHRFLPDWQAGAPIPANAHEAHDEILARSAFSRVNRRSLEFTRSWTIDQALGYLYSTSLPLLELLGDQRADFERDVTDALLSIDAGGLFLEPVTLEVLTATRA